MDDRMFLKISLFVMFVSGAMSLIQMEYRIYKGTQKTDQRHIKLMRIANWILTVGFLVGLLTM